MEKRIAEEAPGTARPFLKWAGGKRWLVSRYLHEFPEEFGTYIEPFFGSGAVFFALEPESAIISDANADLINCYMQIREKPANLRDWLVVHQANHSKDYYYQIRSSEPICPIERAARFLYLNRTC